MVSIRKNIDTAMTGAPHFGAMLMRNRIDGTRISTYVTHMQVQSGPTYVSSIAIQTKVSAIRQNITIN